MPYRKLALLVLLFGLFGSCTKDPGADPSRRPDATYEPQLTREQFLPEGQWKNAYVIIDPGKTYVYAGHTEDGNERMEVIKLSETIEI
ncbi:MAG TPA: hypothetical protein VI603_11740, partial [Saprospiraceae bacterium]|nr:hypothetical protein [Saprospiraceae bacterium]